MKKNELCTKKFMNEIASAIKRETGVRVDFSTKDGDTLVYDVFIGSSYLTNNGGTSLFFALVDNNSRTLQEVTSCNARQFIKQVSYVISTCNLPRMDKPNYELKAQFYAEKWGILSYRVKGNLMIYNQNYREDCFGNYATFQRIVNLDTNTTTTKKLQKRFKDGWNNV